MTPIQEPTEVVEVDGEWFWLDQVQVCGPFKSRLEAEADLAAARAIQRLLTAPIAAEEANA
jgi:hypothetical protein